MGLPLNSFDLYQAAANLAGTQRQGNAGGAGGRSHARRRTETRKHLLHKQPVRFLGVAVGYERYIRPDSVLHVEAGVHNGRRDLVAATGCIASWR